MDYRKTLLPRVGLNRLRWPQLRPFPIALLMIAAGTAASAGWFYGRGAAITTATATRGNVAEIVYATGAVEPERWSKVTPLIKGRIVERCRCEGQAVKARDLLARLDDKEAQAGLRELKAREEYARRDLERQSQLVARGATPTQVHERAQSELLALQAQIAVQTERLENLRLVAPMDGVVLREDGEVGEIVDSATVLFRIGEPRPLQVVAEVNEEDIPRVSVGQKTLFRTDAFPDRRLEGAVREITPMGDPVAKTYRIRIALPDDTPLKPGMSVEANVITREKADVLLVPTDALQGSSVFVVAADRAHRRDVAVGIRGTRASEIVSGLKEGERVVSPAPPDFADGQRVRVTNASAAK